MKPVIDPALFVLFAEVAFFFLVLVLPVVRMLLRQGISGIARPTDRVQAAVKFWMIVLMVGAGVWATVIGVFGLDAVGTWIMPVQVTYVGMGLAVAGLLLTMLAQAQMGRSWRIGIEDERTDLVTGGLYRFTRNPIYTGIFVSLWGLVLVAPSAWSVMGTVAVTMLISLQTRLEEKHLESLHGETYLAWAGRIGRFVPLIGRLRA